MMLPIAASILPENAPLIFTIIAATFVGFVIAFTWIQKQIKDAKSELETRITELEDRVKHLESSRDEARKSLIDATALIYSLPTQGAVMDQIKNLLREALMKLQ